MMRVSDLKKELAMVVAVMLSISAFATDSSTTIGSANQTTIGSANQTTIGPANQTTVSSGNPTTVGPANAKTVANSEIIAETVSEKNWEITPAITASSLAQKASESEAHADLSLEIESTYKITSQWTAALTLGATHTLAGEDDFEIDDGSFRMSKKPTELGRAFKLGFSVQALLPFSVDTWQRKSALTVLGSSANLITNLSAIGIKATSLIYTLSASRGFYRYEETTNGALNKAWSLNRSVALKVTPLEPLVISAVFQQGNAWRMDGLLTQSFAFAEEVGWNFKNDWSVSVGHKNGGDILMPDGINSNISFFNGQTSTVYTTVSKTF